MNKYTLFFGKDSPFSQWHPCTFVIRGKIFNCAEQYMMYKKAMLFRDFKTARKVLNSSDPREQKSLGRQVRSFDNNIWLKHCKNIVRRGNLAKFGQNKHLRDKLFKTSNTTMVEASPYDRLWGIGLGVNHPNAYNEEKWNGKNLLGYILTDVRETLITIYGNRDA